MRDRLKRKRGAALIESSLVIMMLCLILFGMLQVSYLIGARDVVSYASVGVARSAAVGMDDFMLYKAARMFTIPTAGPMSTPEIATGVDPSGNSMGQTWDNAVERNPGSEQYWQERYLIPFYLGAEDPAEARAVLNYDNWEQSATRVQAPEIVGSEAEAAILDVPVRQYVPLALPFSRAWWPFNMFALYRSSGAYNGQVVPHADMRESAGMENHALYYLTNSIP